MSSETMTPETMTSETKTSETMSPEIGNQELVDRKAAQRTENPPPALDEDLVDANLGVLMDIDMKVTVELGRSRMPLRDILELAPGSVVELGKPPSEPMDLLVNGVLAARGEVVVVDDHFAIRITKLLRRGEQLQRLA